jgi:hypothetical protein
LVQYEKQLLHREVHVDYVVRDALALVRVLLQEQLLHDLHVNR